MTPKEKAQYLFNKMDMIIYTDQDDWKSQCKRCAIITVDEIINACELLNIEILHTEYGDKLTEINGEIRTNYVSFVIYWNNVKTEIEKL